jgi:NADH-quinone oxidoreductase subunit L
VSPKDWQEWTSSGLALALGGLGIGVAWVFYGARRRPVPRFAFAQRTLERKFYFDELYDAAFYRPSAAFARALTRSFERPFILGSGREIGDETRDLGGLFARLQTGLLRTYALAIASSLAVLAIVFVAIK